MKKFFQSGGVFLVAAMLLIGVNLAGEIRSGKGTSHTGIVGLALLAAGWMQSRAAKKGNKS
jgi:hypothetical protein